MRASWTRMFRIVFAMLFIWIGAGPWNAGAAQEAPGVTGPASYESPQFGYEVTWDDLWTVIPELTNSDQGLDGLTLDSELAARVQIFGVDPSLDPAQMLTSLVSGTTDRNPDATVTSEETDSDAPALTLDYELSGTAARQRFEARLLPSGSAVVAISFLAPLVVFDSNLEIAQAAIRIDGDPLFAGIPGGNADEPTPEPKETPKPEKTPRPSDNPREDASQLDIAAIPFLPAAIDDEGWGMLGGQDVTSLAEVARTSADVRGGATDDNISAMEDRLSEWGWQRTFILTYGQPGDESGRYDRQIQVVIDQYEDEAGAREGFDFFSDTSGITAYEATEEEPRGTFGDESAGSRLSGEADTGEAFDTVGVDFRVGNFVAGVTIVDYAGGRLRMADAEELAGILETQIESALDDGTATLGLAAIGLEGDALAWASENYLRLDGETIPYVWEAADAIEARDAEYGNADDVYAAYHQIAAGDDGPEDDANVNVWLYRFGSERAARRWFDATRERFDLADDATPTLGDDSFGYASELDRGDPGVSTGYVIYVRVGADVALIDMAAIEGVELDTVVALAEEQVDCLERGACRGPLDVPGEMADRAPAAEETPAPEKETSPGKSSDTGSSTDAAVYRGDLARTGILPGPAPSGNTDVQWTYQMGDVTYSTVAVADGVVYGTSHDGNLYALDAESGEELWVFDGEDSQSSPPTVADGIVYYGTEGDMVYAVDAATGDGVWQFEAGSYVYGSPAAVDGVLYVGSGSGLYALDAATGEQLWELDLGDGQSFREPAVVDGVIYAVGDNTAVAVDPESGEPLWQHELPEDAREAPAVAGGIVYLACEDGNVYALDAESGDEVWSALTNEDGDYVEAVGVADGLVFAVDEGPFAYAFDAESGGLVWTYESEDGFEYGAPVIVDGSVYLASLDGSVYELDAESGEELRRIGLADSWLTGDVVVVDGWIYVNAEDGTIYAVS